LSSARSTATRRPARASSSRSANSAFTPAFNPIGPWPVGFFFAVVSSELFPANLRHTSLSLPHQEMENDR
jgi:hypothetical protein